MQKSIPETNLTVAYARVSSHDQKEDLERQANALEIYCMQKGWNFQVIKDLGSGMNYQKKGLKTLLTMMLESKATRLVLTHKDRLLRFGAELIFALCEAKQIEVVIINKLVVIRPLAVTAICGHSGDFSRPGSPLA